MSEPTQNLPSATTGPDAELLAALADDFGARLRRREHPTVEEYVARHPALAERIRNVLSAVALIEQGRTDPALSTEGPGSTIGRYKLLERIGEGGFGVVYMAEQQHPVRRKVALKLIKPGMDSRQVLARFDAERQALAIMDHPNIARVFDGGVTDTGRPYFVMELVKGEPITAYCDHHQLPPSQRLELFVAVCQAVQHAHQKGIIHRDLKPTNVLVATHDTKPVVKVIDFGVAKALGQELTDNTLFTGFAQLLGTPLYMSPEQAGHSSLDVDTRSDIYSLGVLLYELLTGTTPFDKERFKKAADDEIRRIIREEEPPRPSTRLSASKDALPSISANRHTEPTRLTKLVRGELDWIVMKALEKDRNRRYETANGFAADVQRYLNDEPVQACPPSARYRLRKFVRRNKAALAVTSLLLLFLVLLGSGIGWAVGDRTARQAKVAGQVELILSDVDRLQREQKWPEALVAMRRADAVVAGGNADASTALRVRERLKELEFIDRLEQIRMQQTWTEGRADRTQTTRAYAGAFRDYGVDVEQLPVEASIERLKTRPTLIVPIAAALDTWGAWYVQSNAADAAEARSRLSAIASAIDPEPLREVQRSNADPGQVDELLRLAESIDVRAHHPATLNRVASALLKAGRSEPSLRLLRKAQSAYPQDFWLNYNLGVWFQEQNDLGEAVRFYSVAVAVRPRAITALNNLGNVLRSQNKLDEAVSCYRAAIEADPRFVVAHSNLGIALSKQKKFDEAVACYRRAIEINPKSSTAYNNLGAVLADQRKLDEAVAAYRKAIELNPRLANSYIGLATALRVQGKRDEAAAAYWKVIELSPQLASTHIKVGTYFSDDLNDYAAALVCFRKAIELDPKSAAAYAKLGTALVGQRKLDEGIVNFRKALELDPKSADPYCHLSNTHGRLAHALQTQGKFEEAIASYGAGLAADPQSAWTYNGLAWLLATCREVRLRDPARAAVLARRAVELAPENADYFNTLGVAEYRAGNWQAAVEALTKSVSLHGDRSGDASDWFFLAMACWQLGNNDEARRWFDRGVGWMELNHSTSAQLTRFRAEAAELMGVDAQTRHVPSTAPATTQSQSRE